MPSLLPLLLPAAQAFCGTYLASSDAALVNQRSQVVLARQGTRTTLTLSPDYTGDPTEFAMLIPVPQVLEEGDVRTVDASVVARVAQFGAPRLVGYSCANLHGWDSGWGHYGGSDGDSSGGCGRGCGANSKDGSGDTGDSRRNTDTGADEDGEAWDVAVESEFAVGSYEIVTLSADDAADLLGWLGDNGYVVSADAESMLQDYLDQGVFFIAAKVSLDAAGAGEGLPPLQFAYESELLSLPMKLGTLNSPGEQDVLVHVLGDNGSGRAGISNYPELALTDECMWAEEAAETFTAFVERSFDADFAAADAGAAWAVEHAWSPSSCDPCTGPTLDTSTLAELGYSGGDAFLTRLHVRTTPEAAGEDLTFYFSNDAATEQLKFIQYGQELESDFPICGQGWVTDDPGSCEDDERGRRVPAGARHQAVPVLPLLLGLLLVGAAARRRPAQD
jgi:hypothetical protein